MTIQLHLAIQDQQALAIVNQIDLAELQEKVVLLQIIEVELLATNQIKVVVLAIGLTTEVLALIGQVLLHLGAIALVRHAQAVRLGLVAHLLDQEVAVEEVIADVDKKIISMKKYIYIIPMFVLGIGTTFAQNSGDALRYSQTTLIGSARFNGMGGAFGALGNDYTGTYINPAGFSVFRNDYAGFSFDFMARKSDANYFGSQNDDSKINLNLSSLGFVKHIDINDNGWDKLSISFGLNRTNNFHRRLDIIGTNTQNSLADVFLKNANNQGYTPDDLDPFNEQLAFDTYLLDTVGGATNYESPVPSNSGSRQNLHLRSNGYTEEFSIGFGAKYEDNLYIGLSIGINGVKYEETRTHTESEFDPLSSLHSFTFNNYLKTTGGGATIKLGFIYTPTKWFRLGMAYHSPTWYTLTDDYASDMQTTFKDSAQYNANSPDGSFDYRINTPMKVITSVGFVIGRYGIISADYEFVDYTTARIKSDNYHFFNENNAITTSFKPASNIRVGAELRIAPTISLRGGYSYLGSPYEDDINNGGESVSYSGGIGFKEDNFSIDFAYVYTQQDQQYYLYDSAINTPADLETITKNFIASFTYHF